MSQPLDRSQSHEVLGRLDVDAGELWVENPFHLPALGENLSAYEENRVFINARGKEFIDASFASGANLDSDSRSVIAGDFNNDGAQDLLVGSVGGGPIRLFLNRIPQGNSIELTLQHRGGQAAAIGARVIATVGSKTIVRDLFSANGCLGQQPARMVIGLGNAEQVDSLTIRWPDGKLQELGQLSTGSRVTISQGSEPVSQPL
ncbi:MAG: CRTAC1 family protein [Rhodopirellula sp.]|nr:CRTAC1 family protein [Rhodopirellula sp.]